MIPYKSPLLTAVPQSLEKRLEIMNAIRTLTAPDGDDQVRKRQADIAALRRDLEEIREGVLDLWRQSEPWSRSYVIKYKFRSAARAGRQSRRRAVDKRGRKRIVERFTCRAGCSARECLRAESAIRGARYWHAHGRGGGRIGCSGRCRHWKARLSDRFAGRRSSRRSYNRAACRKK